MSHGAEPRYDDASREMPLSPATPSYGPGSGAPHPQRDTYPPQDDILPAGPAGSTASLPRYPSSGPYPQQSPTGPRPYSASSSVYSSSGGGTSGNGARYSGYGADPTGRPSAHPLSHAVFADSTPTLAGSGHGHGPNDSSLSVLKTRDDKGSYSRPGQSAPPSQPVVPTVSAIGRVNAGYRPEPSGIRGLYWRWGGGNVARQVDDKLIKPDREGWIDGLKFFAAWIAANGTFFDAVLSDQDYTAIQRGSPLYVFRSFGLGLSMLLLLSGRALAGHLWDSRVTHSQASNSLNAPAPSPSISWARLTRAMLVRPFRFILPVLLIAGVQWALGATGKTSNCNAVGMQEPGWNQIVNFGGYSTLVFDTYTWFEWETVAAKVFAGNLWTNAWFFQSSYCTFVTHMMLGNLSSNRYWVYLLLAFFSWTTFNFFTLAVAGLALADMHAHGQFAKIHRMNLGIRLLTHIVLIGIIVLVQFINPIRDNLNSGMAVINVTGHSELTFADLLTVICVAAMFEISPLMQLIIGNIVFRALGRVTTAGLYLFAALFTFTVVPNLALSMHNNGSSPSSITGISWVVMFVASLLVAIPFHFVIELPSKHFGERFANFVTNWGADVPKRGGPHGKQGGRLRDAVHAPAPSNKRQ